MSDDLIQYDQLDQMIRFIRGQRVILDSDLAPLYGVATKRLNEQVKRNLKRFPDDFMFQLKDAEEASLRSQIATSKQARGGRRYRPFAFTEQGVAILSSVLNSEHAIQVNVAIMRAFVQLRRMASENQRLAAKINSLEKKYDKQFKVVFDAIRQLMFPAPKGKQRIGF